MIARHRPMHPLAVRYWLWRGQLVINGSPDNRPAAQYRALRDTALALVGYVLGIVAFAYIVGEQDELWAALQRAIRNRRDK